MRIRPRFLFCHLGLRMMMRKGRFFVKYIPPPWHNPGCELCPVDLEDEIVEWKERMKYFHEDFNWLLALTDEAFWDQITCDETFNFSLDSFLQFCPRYFDQECIPIQCKKIQNSLKKILLLIILRISEFSKNRCNSIYENYLLDIPKILDICVIYGGVAAETKALISHSIQDVFDHESRYWEDFEAAMHSFFQSLKTISDKLGLNCGADQSPKELQRAGREDLRSHECEDILQYLHDSAHTLALFPDFCGVASQRLLQNEAITCLAQVVDEFLPALECVIDQGVLKEKKRMSKRIRKCIAHLIHSILQNYFTTSSSSDSQDCNRSGCEHYLNTIASLLPYTRFIRCYEKYHGIEKDLKNNIDRKIFENDETFIYIKQILSSLTHVNEAKESNKLKQFSGENAWSTLSEEEYQKSIKQIKALFPDEEEEFLREFLVHRNGNAESVINDIIEENIPLFLQEIKRAKNRKRDSANYSEIQEGEGKISGTFYLKKDRISKNEQQQILNDKSHSKYVLSYVETSDNNKLLKWIGENPEQDCLYDAYDDEYDDTYDSQNIGAMDADSGDELKDIISRRTLVKPRVLEALERNVSSSSSESNSETEEASAATANDNANIRHGAMWKTHQSNRGQGQGNRGQAQGNRGQGRGRRVENSQNRNGAMSHKNGGGDKPFARGGATTRGKKRDHKSMAAKKKSRGMGPV